MLDQGDGRWSDVVNFEADGKVDLMLVSGTEAECCVVIIGEIPEELECILVGLNLPTRGTGQHTTLPGSSNRLGNVAWSSPHKGGNLNGETQE